MPNPLAFVGGGAALTAADKANGGAYCTAHLDGLAATSHPSLVVAARCMRAALITALFLLQMEQLA
ncbi:hypothetical protein EMIHUDRAFT_221949 [Emiliania huxleyi CCMP1516]|uniref:Uncharacterized protein n=2 Tax=Emiliania huxleyi TaxID=2903 RepID=A0A0D3HXP3_EMIH1|nr:hypothetical protein EMIHUDRAFT_221949 [Emiliania huxleyi CCMP1516]EOD03778.1 hypothetical protein EMIHUDRAFT_221949 [Emiliania huxleyi CCMP1516]|eukprot:XP_005756207.1 hypothetical protein EMIHUDRAFT_221949 [Emiliania huxleyi CCMP1516]